MKTGIYIKFGKIVESSGWDWLISRLADGFYEVEVTSKIKRTKDQNSYFHAVMIPLIKDGLIDMGFKEVKTNEDAKTVVKALFFKKTISNGIEEISIYQDTSELTKEEFSKKIDEIKIWAAEYLGINIPDPPEKF